MPSSNRTRGREKFGSPDFACGQITHNSLGSPKQNAAPDSALAFYLVRTGFPILFIL